jgi:hypothetical protein
MTDMENCNVRRTLESVPVLPKVPDPFRTVDGLKALTCRAG